MKKNYLMILMVSIITSSAVLFPGTIHSQDLTDAERKERCQNNKNRIAELEPQLKFINAALSKKMSNKEIEDARKEMVLVRSKWQEFAKDKFKKDDRNSYYLDRANFRKIRRIASHYNFKFDDCYEEEFQDVWNLDAPIDASIRCLQKLEDMIATKIDKGEALKNNPKILAKKNDIEKQLAFHRNNLVALGCDQISDATTYDPKSVAGTWNWSFAPAGQTLVKHGTVTFQTTGENSGTMSWSGGSQGHWTQSGQRVTLTWENNPSQDNMTLSADGHNLSGSNNKGWPVEGTRGMK